MRSLLRFLREESGVTSVEYAVLLALILLTTMAGIRMLTNGAAGMWNNNNEQLISAGFATPAP